MQDDKIEGFRALEASSFCLVSNELFEILTNHWSLTKESSSECFHNAEVRLESIDFVCFASVEKLMISLDLEIRPTFQIGSKYLNLQSSGTFIFIAILERVCEMLYFRVFFGDSKAEVTKEYRQSFA